MGQTSWLDQVSSVQIPPVAGKLGLSSGRGRSWGPCPKCGAAKRGSDDERGPLGLTSDGKGWACHAGCGAEGDLADLVSYQTVGERFRDAQQDQRAEVRKACAAYGFWVDSNPHGLNGLDDVEKMIRRKTPADQVVTTAPLVEPADKGDGLSRVFSWRPEFPAKAFELLWNDPDCAPVLDYLRTGRGLPDETIRAWGLGAIALKQQGRVTDRFVVIPLVDATGTPINLKFRSVPGPCLHCSPDGTGTGPGCRRCEKSKSGPGTVPKIYRACAGRPLPLFGGDKLSPGPVIVVEGELDVIALDAYGFRGNVVSGTAGAGHDWPDDWLDRLEHHSHFTLALDNDAAGDAGVVKLAEKFGKYRCSRAKLPRKDAGECLTDGVSPGQVRAALDNAIGMVGIELVTPDAFGAEIEALIKNPSVLKGLQCSIPAINEAWGGLTPGLHIFSGETGMGKTTLTTFLLWDLASLGNPVLLTSFEQSPVQTATKLLRMELGGDFTKRTEAERLAALTQLKHKRITIANKYGDVTDQEVIETIRYARRRRGIRVAMIDHLDFVIRFRRKGEDEREAKERVVRELATIGVQDDIAIILIVHPNNQASVQQRRVQMGDLKGASAIRQDAHSCVIVDKVPPTNQRPFPAAALFFDKIRSDFGTGSGTQRILAYDGLSCQYASRWEDTPSGKAGITVVIP